MVKRTSSKTKELFLDHPPKELTVDRWVCPICREHQVSVYLDGSIVYGGEFWRGDGKEGCVECFSKP